MNQIMEVMRRKVLGVPLGVFAALFAAALLYYAIKMRPSTSTPDDTLEADYATDDAPAGDIADLQQPVFAARPTVYQPSGVSVSAVSGEDTNELWGARVRSYLIAQGATVDVATAVVYKYLNGVALSANETTWRDKAVKQYGFPPDPVDYVAPKNNGGGTVYNGPAVSQGKAPLNHEVKGKSDNQAKELALLYYGVATEDAVSKIRAANVGKVEPYVTGTRVHIPSNYEPRYYKATAATRTSYDIASKNGTTDAKLRALNPGMKFPVKIGTRVRVR